MSDPTPESILLAGTTHGLALSRDLLVQLLQQHARHEAEIGELQRQLQQLGKILVTGNGASLVTQVAMHGLTLERLGAAPVEQGAPPSPSDRPPVADEAAPSRPAVQIALITLISTVLTAVIALIRDWLIGARIPHP